MTKLYLRSFSIRFQVFIFQLLNTYHCHNSFINVLLNLFYFLFMFKTINKNVLKTFQLQKSCICQAVLFCILFWGKKIMLVFSKVLLIKYLGVLLCLQIIFVYIMQFLNVSLFPIYVGCRLSVFHQLAFTLKIYTRIYWDADLYMAACFHGFSW